MTYHHAVASGGTGDKHKHPEYPAADSMSPSQRLVCILSLSYTLDGSSDNVDHSFGNRERCLGNLPIPDLPSA